MTPRRVAETERIPLFSKRWWLSVAQNLFWVALVTVLIWVYADMEFTDTERFTAEVVINANDASNMTLYQSGRYELQFELAGSQTVLAKFRRELATQRTLNYNVSQDYSPKDKNVSSADLLRRAAKANNLDLSGLTIKRIDPAIVTLPLDELTTVENVPVELASRGADLEKPPVAQKVNIRVSRSGWERIEARLKGRTPVLYTQEKDLSGLSPGKEERVTATIIPSIEGVDVTPNPSEVTFTVQIISPTETQELQVSVEVLCPTSWVADKGGTWAEYVFVPNPASDWRPKLKVIGRKNDLLPENIRAYIRLTDLDKKPVESWLERDVIVDFKPGLNLKLQGQPPKALFRLEKRKPDVPTTP